MMLTDSLIKRERSNWGAVVAMSVGAFTMVAAEMMPISLLTPIAHDLKITPGQAGLGLTMSATFALLMGISIAPIASRVRPRALIFFFLLLLLISGAMNLLASNFAVYLVSRALIGAAVGGFWPLAAGATVRLVSVKDGPRALAILNAGNALAAVLAIPAGSYLGSVMGWQSALLCLSPLALAVIVWVYVGMPKDGAILPSASPSGALKLLSAPPLAYGMLGIFAFYMGEYILFSYLRPYLESAVSASATTISVILLLIGVSGLLGTFIISFLLKHCSIYSALIATPVVMALIALGLIYAHDSVVIVTLLLSIWGMFGTAVPVAWLLWVAREAPDSYEAGCGMYMAVSQVSFAAAASVGGILYDSEGYHLTFQASALLLLCAAAITIQASRASALSQRITLNC